MSKKVAPNRGTIWFDKFVEENRTEILIYGAMLEIACQIKIEREKQSLSQRELAEKTNLTQATIVRLEKGKNSNLQTLIKVANTLGVSVKIKLEKV